MAVVGKTVERDNGGCEGTEKSGICFSSVLVLFMLYLGKMGWL